MTTMSAPLHNDGHPAICRVSGTDGASRARTDDLLHAMQAPPQIRNGYLQGKEGLSTHSRLTKRTGNDPFEHRYRQTALPSDETIRVVA